MWLTPFFAGGRTHFSRPSPARRPASSRLTVEALEDRTVPSFLAPMNTPALGAVTVGDFNNDGIPDLIGGAYYQYPYWSWNILLGNGDGTFQPGRPVDLY